MKRFGFILVFFIMAASTNLVKAQGYKAALGVRFSTGDALVNNSISFKYFLNQKTAVESLICFGDPFALGFLLEQHKPVLGDQFSFVYGGGLYIGFSGDRVFGLHGILGLDYKMPSIPINLSLDWKPELTAVKLFSFEPAALGLTARFTIK
jgi:hypothetical protein